MFALCIHEVNMGCLIAQIQVLEKGHLSLLPSLLPCRLRPSPPALSLYHQPGESRRSENSWKFTASFSGFKACCPSVGWQRCSGIAYLGSIYLQKQSTCSHQLLREGRGEGRYECETCSLISLVCTSRFYELLLPCWLLPAIASR